MPEEALRADGMFGPPIEVPADADDQTRFLAYVGRRASELGAIGTAPDQHAGPSSLSAEVA